jgi:hypothetical protein
VPRPHRVAKATGGVLTLAIALWGAVTGTLAWLDQQRFEIIARTEPYVASGARNPIRLTLVNRSRQPVSLVGGVVKLDGETIGRLTRATPTRASGDELRTPAQLMAESEALPLDLPPGASFAGAVLWEVPANVRAGQLAKISLPPPEAGTGNEVVEDFFAPPKPVDVDLRLRLDFGGGDEEELGLRAVRPSASDDIAPVVELELRRRRVVGLRALSPALLEPTIATLQLWSERATRPLHTVQRPLGSAEQARMPLPGLHPGSYTWALRYRGETAAGSFTTPCHPGPDYQRTDVVPSDLCAATP